MSDSNDGLVKPGSIKLLTSEEDKAEDEEIKAKVLANLYQTRGVGKKSSSGKKRPKALSRADGVRVPGVCPDCGGALRTVADRHGKPFTVCEHFKNGCIFYVPYNSSHFSSK